MLIILKGYLNVFMLMFCWFFSMMRMLFMLFLIIINMVILSFMFLRVLIRAVFGCLLVIICLSVVLFIVWLKIMWMWIYFLLVLNLVVFLVWMVGSIGKNWVLACWLLWYGILLFKNGRMILCWLFLAEVFMCWMIICFCGKLVKSSWR